MDNGKWEYYRKCPYCGHLEKVNQLNVPEAPPIPQPAKKPLRAPAANEISNINQDGGGVEAGWR